MSNILSGRKVAIIGLGVSGKSALKMVSKLGAEAYASDIRTPVDCLADKDIAAFLKIENCFQQNDPKWPAILSQMDWILLSPGIPTNVPFLELAKLKKIPIVNEIELACRMLKAPMIAVTGTNGKTTTVTLIGEIAKRHLKNVFVGGNIGTPLAEAVLQKEQFNLIVLEVSSFQLESMIQFHPNVGVILNIAANHGERYPTVEEYAAAKYLICKNMVKDDCLIYNQDYQPHHLAAAAGKFSTNALSSAKISQYKNELSKKYDLSKFKLPGDHNIYNLYAAILSLRFLKMENHEAIQDVINHFPGVPNRIEYVPNDTGHLVYNDAKSTNWEATLTALKAMPRDKGPVYLILGGQARGRGDEIGEHISEFKKYAHSIYLIGDMADALAAELKGNMPYKVTRTLEMTWQDLQKEQNGVVLLSPAYPSFDQFKNYSHRGECFRKIVNGKN